MALIAVSPFVLRDITLAIASSNYETSVSAAEFVPSSSVVTFKGLKAGSTVNLPTEATWVANLTYAQDWTNEDSLSNYLLDNAGETVVAVFAPKAGGPSFSAQVTIVPGSIGGAGDAIATASVSLTVNGEPSRVA